MTIVDALKAKGATGSTIAEAVTTLPSGGGSGLPEVSTTDNGDVLTVVEGAWAKAAPSGGASYDYEISLAMGLGPSPTPTLISGSYADMVAKLRAGTPVFGRVYGVTAMAEAGFYQTTEMCALSPFLNVTIDPPNPDTESLAITVYTFLNGASGVEIMRATIDWASDDTLTFNTGE